MGPRLSEVGEVDVVSRSCCDEQQYNDLLKAQSQPYGRHDQWRPLGFAGERACASPNAVLVTSELSLNSCFIAGADQEGSAELQRGVRLAGTAAVHTTIPTLVLLELRMRRHIVATCGSCSSDITGRAWTSSR